MEHIEALRAACAAEYQRAEANPEWQNAFHGITRDVAEQIFRFGFLSGAGYGASVVMRKTEEVLGGLAKP